MYLLDTDTLTHLHAGNSNVVKQLNTVEDDLIAITIITKIEVLRGRIDYVLKADTGEKLIKAQELLFRTEELLNQLPIIPISQLAADEFNRLRAISKLRKIGQADLLIASITLVNRAILVTRNLRHFQQIPGIKVVNWVD
ncbi:type II toxin-antitoxin system VapC family toxin [Dolichospermum circinale CS-1225]|uniref:type II toxin-antitoxin system VapC family toxin n=1 Tax=Dolichospermum circinale TaxID=109265 RepID=UPI0004869A95|nr:type II toxin-antitoxin system VapC family toxin [Dolichospermum circinale]MDB9466350.1 type II toxin-antitoxin system VapC family toxin [Dolichospermum circinale CS-539/09]MDB9470078.1 type II toxin-antitoxin system VapC family toxin [Dolichospermum circinale CS-539]MDB9521248.1 type II toxin-antitoxin system VapC family toxin [Dolichospermum circinale CS-1225]